VEKFEFKALANAAIHIACPHEPTLKPKASKEYVYPNALVSRQEGKSPADNKRYTPCRIS